MKLISLFHTILIALLVVATECHQRRGTSTAYEQHRRTTSFEEVCNSTALGKGNSKGGKGSGKGPAAPSSPGKGSGKGPAAPSSPGKGSGKGPAVPSAPSGSKGGGKGPAVPSAPSIGKGSGKGSGKGPAVPSSSSSGKGSGKGPAVPSAPSSGKGSGKGPAVPSGGKGSGKGPAVPSAPSIGKGSGKGPAVPSSGKGSGKGPAVPSSSSSGKGSGKGPAGPSAPSSGKGKGSIRRFLQTSTGGITLITNFTVYIGYTGLDITFSGSASMTFPDECFDLTGSVTNFLPDCVDCRVVVHEGDACSGIDPIVPYYEPNEVATDPFASTTFTTDSTGAGSFTFTGVCSGNGPEDNVENPFLVLDSTGAIAACGILTYKCT